MNVQIYSDIHLEHHKTYPKIEPKADTIILSGDIGNLHLENYKDFLVYLSENWKNVIYVLGNHEYYHNNKTITKLNEEYKIFINKFSNVYLLDRNYIIIDNIAYIGCTLWSKATIGITDIINDFNMIKVKREFRRYMKTDRINEYEYNKLNMIDTEYLLETLQILQNDFNHIVIVTHYPLIQQNTSNPIYKYQNQCLKDYFSNKIDLTKYMGDKTKIVCISGHTHWSYDFTENDIRYISNQFGYASELRMGESKLKVDGLFTLFRRTNTNNSTSNSLSSTTSS